MALRRLSRVGDDGLLGDNLDVRGWDVRTDLDDEKVGSVEDMIVDDGGRPRYLDVDLGLFKKHVLLPLRQARADGTRDIVWVPGLTKDRFTNIPAWDADSGRIDPDYDARIAAALRGDAVEDRREEVDRDEPDMPRLAALDDLDGYRIPGNEPDPTGWAVVTADGRKVGEVEGLIVDTTAMKVRYLDCDLDREKLGFNADRERHVLIPTSRTHLDTAEEQVLVDGLTVDGVRDLPVFGGLPIASDFEDQLRSRFQNDQGEAIEPGDDERFYAERRSAVTEAEEANERGMDVRVGEEERLRRDADEAALGSSDRLRARDISPSGAGDPRTDKEIRIRVRGDEIIVEKRPLE